MTFWNGTEIICWRAKRKDDFMKYIMGSVCMIILLVVWIIFQRNRTVYKIQLFVRNTKGEFLLVYNQRARRFDVLSCLVGFDEIPTQLIGSVMQKMVPGSGWSFDYQYHFRENKYDRVRDDIGPVCTYEDKTGFYKKYVLCYVLGLMEYQQTFDWKRMYPYPEFYSLKEIASMSEDIRPPRKNWEIMKGLSGKGESN